MTDRTNYTTIEGLLEEWTSTALEFEGMAGDRIDQWAETLRHHAAVLRACKQRVETAVECEKVNAARVALRAENLASAKNSDLK